MNDLILRVERHGENAVHMFQVPYNTEINLLQRMVARTMNWDRGPQGLRIEYQVEAQQLGRRLSVGENLSQAGVLDNFLLVFHNNDYNFKPIEDSKTGLLPDPTAEIEAILKQHAPSYSSSVSENVPLNNVPAASPPVIEPAADVPKPAVHINKFMQEAQSNNPILDKNAAPLNYEQQADPNLSPVSGWRSLDIEVPPSAKDAPLDNEEEAKKSAFVWRKLD